MKYVILGSYGATNIGDEAILASIIESLKEQDEEADITVMSYDPGMTKRMHGVKSVHQFPAGFRSFYRCMIRGGIGATIKSLRGADQLIFGGGGLFTDDKLMAVFLWFWQIFWASKFCENIVFYRQTVGKLSTKIGRLLTKWACSYCEEIIVRDKESKNLLQYLGVKSVKVMKDPVLEWRFVKRYVKDYYQEAYKGNVPSAGKRGYVIVSVREWHYKKEGFLDYIAEALVDYCSTFGYEIVFVPFQVRIEDDRPIFDELKSRIAGRVNMRLFRLNYSSSFESQIKKLLDLYLGSERVVAMRLHALIFAYLCKLDTVGIVYGNKVQSFVDTAGFKSVNTRTIDGLKKLL